MGNSQCGEGRVKTPGSPNSRGLPDYASDYVATLERRLHDLELAHAYRTHSAVVFIKPHAVTDAVKQLVRDKFAHSGIYILSEGVILAERIDKEQLIDTHYGAIAAKAVKSKPAELLVQPKAQETFASTFGLSWDEALKSGKVYNAMDAAQALHISNEELGTKWGAIPKESLLKFGGGFYCGKINDIFVINGFYLNMRAKFTKPGTCIHFFNTEWDARALSWKDFRGKVLGATDPSTAVDGAIRSSIFKNWEHLGLKSLPNTADNGVHASASPFEALAERANWLGVTLDSDFFGRAIMAKGVPLKTVQDWCTDPTVNYEDKKQSLFDLLEDLNSRECLNKCEAIQAANLSD